MIQATLLVHWIQNIGPLSFTKTKESSKMAAVKIMFYVALFGGAGYGFLKLVEGNEEKLKKELEPSLANKSGFF